jgi:poly-gamma-glutamate capsule biosynthesis protein CapA/YwtB (metallophosphatase superfamily)
MSAYPELIKDVFAEADIRFAQCEKVYSTRGSLQVHGNGHYSRQHPRLASIFTDAGFDIVSVAGNHAMDWGPDALLDTIELMNDMGIKTVGGGRTLEEARRPAYFDVGGVRVGFLGYCSVLREGYAATPTAPGVAPMRAHTYYEAQEYQPGTPPRIVTIPYAEDLDNLCADVERVKQEADVAVVSMHWGIHILPKVLADYETTVARAAFARGADLIVGHHPHVPKGIQVIDDKVCFHSVGHFMFSQPELANHVTGHVGGNRYGVEMDPEYPRLPFGPDGKRSLIARAELTKLGAERVSFLPVIIDTRLRPEVLTRSDGRFDEAVERIRWLSEGLPGTLSVEGDEVVASA